MSLSFGGNLSPLPVSTSTRRPATSTSRQRVVYSQRLRACHETSFDHSVFGTTPCMAPPSRRKLPPLSIVRRASPSVSIARSCHGAAVGAAPSTGKVVEPALTGDSAGASLFAAGTSACAGVGGAAGVGGLPAAATS